MVIALNDAMAKAKPVAAGLALALLCMFVLRAGAQTAGPQDKRIAAQGLLAEAEQLKKKETAAALKEALAKAENAIALWQELGDNNNLASAINLAGDLYRLLGDYEQALKQHDEALGVSRTKHLAQAEIDSLNALAQVLYILARNEPALAQGQRALQLSVAQGYRQGEANALLGLGDVAIDVSRYQDANDYYQRALPLCQELNDLPCQARAWHGIGWVSFDRSDLEQALACHRDRALPLWRAASDKRGEGNALIAVAATSLVGGNRQQALDYLSQARAIFEELDDFPNLARVKGWLGQTYFRAGQFELARDFEEAAISAFHKLGLRYEEANMARRLGMAYEKLGNTAKALEYYNRFTNLAPFVADPRLTAFVIRRTGDIYFDANDKTAALEAYQRSRNLLRQTEAPRDEVDVLNRLAVVYEMLGQKEQALTQAAAARDLGRQIAYRDGQALALFYVARFKSANSLPEAKDFIEQALSITETLRTSTPDDGSRASYFATVREYYELYVDVLMRLNRPVEAWQVSERSRARTLWEALGENRAELRQGADAAWLRRERETRQKLNAAAARHTELLSKKDPPAAEVEESGRKVRALEAEADQIRGELRRNSPRYAALTQAPEVKMEQIQALLGADTTLLEYSLGEERSYLWAVNQKGVTSYTLPPRREIEALALRVRRAAGSDPKSFDPAEREAAQSFDQEAAALSRMLVTPAAEQIKGQRLAFVADGALQLVPFAALPEPETQVQRPKTQDQRPKTQNPPLLAAHEIVYLPSAAVLEALARETQTRRPAPKAVAILADPVFDTNDKRFLDAAQTPPALAANRPAPKSVIRRGRAFGRLLSAGDEAREVQKLAGPGQSLVVTGLDATREVAVSPALREYRSALFATHAFIDPDQPALSGIVLSLVDKTGQPLDGYLRLHDIYNLDLNADLVVLSACETGLGKEVKGEGLSSLARGFMYAGAPRVVASLWQVDDERTQQLTTNFYAALLNQKKPAAAALREAQLAVRRKYPAPYYWAAFTLQGEWR
jgi:CHAT domain-containing protein